MPIASALDYVAHPEKRPLPPFCAIAGDEPFLRREVFAAMRAATLGNGDGAFSLAKFDGATATFRDVAREVAMIGLFGSGKRLVAVEQAEPFASQFKAELEDYLDAPRAAGTLVLILSSFPSNTRLYKKTSEKGLVVDCKALSRREIVPWIVDWAPKRCGASLSRDVAETLVELLGDDMGVLEQETKRLALLAPGGKIELELVRNNVGSQRLRKIWDLVDVALEGNTAEALRQLDKLVAGGEAPIALLAQMAATMRKLAAAAQLLTDADSTKPPISPLLALEKVGVKPFVKAKTAEQLKKLGAKRAKNLIQNLLQADLDMKGGSRSDPRLILERFVAMISNPQMRPFDSLR